MAEEMTERKNCQKFPGRYVWIAALIILGCGLSVFFSFRFDEETDSARYETLFSGKLFTESELLEIEMAFAAAELSDYRITEGTVKIPIRQKNAFVLALKKTSLFESEIEKPSSSGFWVSEKERQAESLKEKQNVLANQLRTFHGIENARVILDICEAKKGFAREKHATASVSIRSRAGYEISQDDVQSILNLVTGAVYGLSSKNVCIVDTRTNRSWKFNEPEVESAPEISAGERVDLRKIVFQGEDLPCPEILDVAARGILEKESKLEETENVERSFGTETISSRRSDSLKPERFGSSEEIFATGTVRIAGGKVVSGKKVAGKSSRFQKENLIFDSRLLPVSGIEIEKNGRPESYFPEEIPQKLPELDSSENSALTMNVNSEMDALSGEMASSEKLLENKGNLIRANTKRADSWPWEATAFLGIASVLVCGICLLVLFMTRKGLFVATSVRRSDLEKRENEKIETADFQNESLQTATVSSAASEMDSVREFAEESVAVSSTVVSFPELSQSENEFDNGRDKRSESERESAASMPRGISEILSTLETIKQEESVEEAVLEEVSIEEKNLLPEIEKLIQVPPRRLALAFLEERPQTAAMLLIHFPDVHRANVLKQIPTNRRLEIESRLTECSVPDEEILLDAAEAILEHLDELETLDEWNSENDLNPAEILFQKEEVLSQSDIRPLGEVLPKEEFSQTDEETLNLNRSSSEFRNGVESLFEMAEERGAASASGTEITVTEVPEVAEDAEGANMESSVCESASDQESSKTAFEGREDWKFADLKYFSDAALKGLLTSSDPDKVVLALWGADSGLINRILGVLPRRESSLLGKQLKQLGRIRLWEVENARREILRRAFELAERGKIELPQTAECI